MTRGKDAAAIGLLLAIAGTVVLGIIFPQTLTSTSLPPPVAGDIAERTELCPRLSRTADGGESATVFSAPTGAAQTGGGEVFGSETGPVPLPPPGMSTAITPAVDGVTLSVRTTGDSSGGTTTARAYLDPADEGRGLALAQCHQARSQWWFVGVGRFW